METETLTRPNGKPYRPRSAPRVDEYVDPSECTAVMVLFTHDTDRAAALAAARWQSYSDCPMPAGQQQWLRLVPFDTGSGYDRNWTHDPVRGTACVVFDHSECCA